MLNGSLDAFALPDVLRFVAGGGITGRIEIQREEVSGELALDQGRFVAASLVDEEAPSTVDEALDVAVLLFDGTSGAFEVIIEDWAGGPLDVDAQELIQAVEKRRQEWAEVVSVLGSLEEPLVLAADLPETTDQITITAEQWRLITLVDGYRSVQDIARDSASSVYKSAVVLADLYNHGMLARGTGVRWQAPAEAKRRASDDHDDQDDDDPADEAAEMLHELNSEEPVDEDEGDVDDVDVEEVTPKGKRAARATVRPLRAPTREEQRIKLRR